MLLTAIVTNVPSVILITAAIERLLVFRLMLVVRLIIQIVILNARLGLAIVVMNNLVALVLKLILVKQLLAQAGVILMFLVTIH